MTTAYIGTKVVAAWLQEKGGELGYAVKYPDGYVSWSPKTTFEQCYREVTESEFNLIDMYLPRGGSK